MPTTDQLRRDMVNLQIAARGIGDPRVLNAMRTIPRKTSLPERLAEFAYEDSPLPIEAGQTISQPYVVALMIEAARVEPGDTMLEIGTGSGYAAAMLGHIAGKVYAIERHRELADSAKKRVARLGYDNIAIRCGDGTHGWLEAAPFDAIVVAAGGPTIPKPLCAQLAIGGRLVIPVGDADAQKLTRVTRHGENDFETEDLGPVRFVPLIGAHGWTGDLDTEQLVKSRSLPRLIADAAEPLPDFDDPDFGKMFERFDDARIVLLGEASHGTSEFYRARAAITRRLIEEHGFTIVAVEADWPDAASIDRYVRQRPTRGDADPAFQRFPTWMWRNQDVEAFTGWLRDHNAELEPDLRASFLWPRPLQLKWVYPCGDRLS